MSLISNRNIDVDDPYDPQNKDVSDNMIPEMRVDKDEAEYLSDFSPKGKSNISWVKRALSSDISVKHITVPRDVLTESGNFKSMRLGKSQFDLNIENLQKLLDHPMNDLIMFDKINNTFKCSDTRVFVVHKGRKVVYNKRGFTGFDIVKKMKGLLPMLKENFWSDYEYEETIYHESTGAGSIGGGRERGILVHKQLMLYSNSNGARFFKKKTNKIHIFTAYTIEALKKWKLRPLISEFMVYDPNLQWSTSADIFLVDEEMNLYIGDFKTGGNSYFERGNAAMKEPLSGLSNCPLNQARIQLFFTMMVLEKYYGIKIKDCLVIQITNKGVPKPKVIPKNMMDNRNALYNELAKTIIKNRMKKKNDNNSTGSNIGSMECESDDGDEDRSRFKRRKR